MRSPISARLPIDCRSLKVAVVSGQQKHCQIIEQLTIQVRSFHPAFGVPKAETAVIRG
ncbi:hypothetical protein D3C81_474780 [compost metagenome]